MIARTLALLLAATAPLAASAAKPAPAAAQQAPLALAAKLAEWQLARLDSAHVSRVTTETTIGCAAGENSKQNLAQ